MKKALLGVVIALVLLAGGCFAVLGAGLNAADEAIKKEEANDKPRAVAVGKAFEHDGYDVDGGWEVEKDALGSADITGLKVTNTHDSREVIQFTFTFVKGKEKLGEVQCNAGELEAGQRGDGLFLARRRLPGRLHGGPCRGRLVSGAVGSATWGARPAHSLRAISPIAHHRPGSWVTLFGRRTTALNNGGKQA